jgi:hypothetical protein
MHVQCGRSMNSRVYLKLFKIIDFVGIIKLQQHRPSQKHSKFCGELNYLKEYEEIAQALGSQLIHNLL